MPCPLLQFESTVTPPEMQDHPKTTDRTAQKAKGYRPERTFQDVLLGSNDDTAKAKTCSVVIHDGRDEPRAGPIQRIHLEGE